MEDSAVGELGDRPVVEDRKVIQKQGRFAGFACELRGPCLLGIVDCWRPRAFAFCHFAPPRAALGNLRQRWRSYPENMAAATALPRFSQHRRGVWLFSHHG